MITFTKNAIFLKCLILTYFLFWIFENVNIAVIIKKKWKFKKNKYCSKKIHSFTLGFIRNIKEPLSTYDAFILSSLLVSVKRILDQEANNDSMSSICSIL